MKIQEEYGGLSNSRDFTWIKPSNEERNNTKEPSERIIENMNSDIIQSEGKSYLRINEKLLDREKYYLLKGNTCYQYIVGVKQVGPDEVKNLIDCIKKNGWDLVFNTSIKGIYMMGFIENVDPHLWLEIAYF